MALESDWEAKLDAQLATLLEARRARGVEDIKCHVEVTTSTDLRSVKRALANVLAKAEAGRYQARDLTDIKSFADIRP